MSGSGAPTLAPVTGTGLRVAIVAASWHTAIMDALIAGAQRALSDAGVSEVLLVRVPGTFELPVLASKLACACDVALPFADGAAQRKWDAIVALGVVIRGGTPHFEYVCQAATMGLTEVSVRTGIPIGFGVLTCDNEEQAFARSGLPGSTEDKGYEAAHAAVTTAITLRELGNSNS